MKYTRHWEMSFRFRIYGFGDDLPYYGVIPAIFDRWDDGWRVGVKLNHESELEDRPHFVFECVNDMHDSFHRCREVAVWVDYITPSEGDPLDEKTLAYNQDKIEGINAGTDRWGKELWDFVYTQLEGLYPSYTIEDLTLRIERQWCSIEESYSSYISKDLKPKIEKHYYTIGE